MPYGTVQYVEEFKNEFLVGFWGEGISWGKLGSSLGTTVMFQTTELTEADLGMDVAQGRSPGTLASQVAM